MAAGERVEVFVAGKPLVFQDPGLRWCMGMEKRCYDPTLQRTDYEALVDEILKHVVVEPKGLTVDDFDSIDDINQILRTYRSFRGAKPPAGAPKPQGERKEA